MSDEQTALSAEQVRNAGLDDWRQLLGRLRARFRIGDFATGVRLVDGIAEDAAAAAYHPDVILTGSDVILTLSSREPRGITSHDIELARRISARARALGIASDISGLTQIDLGLDTSNGEQLAPFYSALLGYAVVRGEPVDASGQVPTVWWQDPHDIDPAYALPDQDIQQRWHFDVWVPYDDAERRLRAVLDAGGRLISDRAAPAFWVVEDADGNRSCICTPAGR